MSITEIEGDLFDAPDKAVLIHACNCQGSWGSGIAAAFKAKYPAAYRIYRAHCLNNQPPKTRTAQTRSTHPLEGTTLLIPPQREDYTCHPSPSRSSRGRTRKRGASTSTAPYAYLLSHTHRRKKKRWIACLFTSAGYGKRKSSREDILGNTRDAVGHLLAQVEALKSNAGERPGALFACRFNAGLFGVPWEETRGVLEEMRVGVTVVRPAGEEE